MYFGLFKRFLFCITNYVLLLEKIGTVKKDLLKLRCVIKFCGLFRGCRQKNYKFAQTVN